MVVKNTARAKKKKEIYLDENADRIRQKSTIQADFETHIENSLLVWNVEKSKITKILNLEEDQLGKSIITWQNQITKRIKNEWTIKELKALKKNDATVSNIGIVFMQVLIFTYRN